jgi:hypothetical protein
MTLGGESTPLYQRDRYCKVVLHDKQQRLVKDQKYLIGLKYLSKETDISQSTRKWSIDKANDILVIAYSKSILI